MLPEPIHSRGPKPDECPTALRQAGKWLTKAIAVAAAAVPLLVCAQAVNGNNVKYFKTAPVHWVETDVGRWLANVESFVEVERNATSVRLKGVTNGLTAVLDLANREYRLSGPNNFAASFPMTGAWTVSGLSANYVEILIYKFNIPTSPTQPRTTEYIGTAGWTELFDNGTSRGWRIHQTRHDGVMPIFPSTTPTSAVTRTWDTISFPDSTLAGGRQITVDVTTGTCQYQGYHCQIRRALAVTGENVGQISYQETNPHGAQYPPLLGKLVKTSNAGAWTMDSGKSTTNWQETARTVDYVDMSIPGTTFKQRFHLNGTTQNWSGSGWVAAPNNTVTFTSPVWRGQLGTVFAPVSPGVSPGFQIQNKTDYPVLVTLEQIGCLYYGIVQPGQVFHRNTGAVWFTIKASMAPNLTEPTVESCIRRPAMYAATIAVAGLTTVGTGGMGTALVVPAMLAAAAGQGAAIATQSALIASGATATEGMTGNVGVATLMRGAAVVGFAMLSSPGGAGTLALNSTVLTAITAIGGTEIYTRYTQQSDIDGLGGQLTQEASVAGAYAGYPWPWTMADRVMPRYDITGGPRIRTTPDGSTIVLRQERALTITRVN
jgi:hypothetical protein